MIGIEALSGKIDWKPRNKARRLQCNLPETAEVKTTRNGGQLWVMAQGPVNVIKQGSRHNSKRLFHLVEQMIKFSSSDLSRTTPNWTSIQLGKRFECGMNKKYRLIFCSRAIAHHRSPANGFFKNKFHVFTPAVLFCSSTWALRSSASSTRGATTRSEITCEFYEILETLRKNRDRCAISKKTVAETSKIA